MKKHMRRIGVCLLAMVLMSLACGCGKKESELAKIEFGEGSPLKNVIPSLDNLTVPKNQNLLTGIGDLTKEAIGKRPVAIMVNNVKAALPQYGIAKADVIFEMPVEGDLTRLMALYADYTQVPDVCAIRSCRYYYPVVAKGFDAFYVHWGMDPSVTGYVQSLNMDRYDGNANTGKLFARDTARKQAGYSLEHTGYFMGTKFAETAKAKGQRLELLDSKKDTAFRFADIGTVVTPTESISNKVQVRFGGATATFTYDAKNHIYLKQFNGQAHVDGKTGEQLSFTNVIVLETSISVRDHVGHKNLNWSGGSGAKGYYFSNGAMQEIRWSKGSEGDYLKFYDLNGQELVINRGKSYIAYTYSGRTSWE